MEPCSFSLFLFSPFPSLPFLRFSGTGIGPVTLSVWYCSGKVALWYKPCQVWHNIPSSSPVFMLAYLAHGYITAIFVYMRVCLDLPNDIITHSYVSDEVTQCSQTRQVIYTTSAISYRTKDRLCVMFRSLHLEKEDVVVCNECRELNDIDIIHCVSKKFPPFNSL